MFCLKCNKIRKAWYNPIIKEYICEIANDNCNGQVVVSGKKDSIEFFNNHLKSLKKN